MHNRLKSILWGLMNIKSSETVPFALSKYYKNCLTGSIMEGIYKGRNFASSYCNMYEGNGDTEPLSIYFRQKLQHVPFDKCNAEHKREVVFK